MRPAAAPKPTARLLAGSGPLAGATLVVTRPSAAAQGLKRRIRALGGTPLGLPGLTLRAAPANAALRAGLAAARGADVVVFVSPAAVRFAFAAHPRLRFARATLVCAIGAATARALGRHGVPRVLWPQRQDSEGLLALPQLARVRGKRIVLIGAPDGRDLLHETLRERRAKLTHLHVYARAAPRYTRAQTEALARAAAPLLTLLSSAQGLATLRATPPLELFARLAAGELVVSSARLAAAARASLFANVHVAASALPADLLDAARLALARHRL